ncbi:MAG: hypothetical protein KGJ58_04405 [Patescibacteria group bacterium]|nr:hypothetical protein [Patescibacteria group bacterium]MDE1988302.1 hypothetical protein [Patescibacteria group bacterium]MDE2218654.1 hypothetical protein [Patescibacteria group bacterium]
MFYFLYGEDKEKSRKKAHEVIDGMIKKRPNASFFKVDSENFSLRKLEEMIGGQGLFYNKQIVFFDNIFENKEAKETILEKIKEIAESPNAFVFLEGKVDKATVGKIEKRAEKAQEFKFAENEGKTREFKKKFNTFSLADVFGRRDKKNLWVLYQEALSQGIAPEEINGILFWQLKSMIVASRSKDIKESGLSPYVFQKSKSFGRNYGEDEMKKLSSALVSVYHDSRRGIHDFDIALERFILSL